MGNARKSKGTRAESGARDRLRLWGLPARRAAQEGRADVGDLHGVEPFVLQVKDWANVPAALTEGLDGAQLQVRAAGLDYGAVVVKRARAHAGRWRVAVTLDDFARILLRLRRAEDLLGSYAPEGYALHRAATEEDLLRVVATPPATPGPRFEPTPALEGDRTS